MSSRKGGTGGVGVFTQMVSCVWAWLWKGLVGTEWKIFLASSVRVGLEKTVLQRRRASISDSEGPVISVIIDCKG